MKRLFAALIVALSAAVPSLAWAGSTEGDKSVLPAEDVAAFADKVQYSLAAHNAHVAIVGRVGRDPDVLPEGIDYTHVAFWVYSQITQEDGSTGTGYRVYNLYQGMEDDTRSSLVQEDPARFFSGVYELDAGIIIPDPRMQERLLEVIASPTYAALHNPSYAVLANPRSTTFQNCTEHTLDVIMAGIYQTDDIPQIKANVAAYFEPQHVQIGGMKRLFAPAMSGAFTTSDHGGRIETATFQSIARFMEENALSSTVYSLNAGDTLGG
jgi:hypothetical protein